MKLRTRKGHDISLPGAPAPCVDGSRPVSSVALIGADYPGLAPTLLVEQGQQVHLGQPVVRDRSGFVLVAPGRGAVRVLRHGARDSLAALVIELDGDDGACAPAACPLPADPARAAQALLATGLWTALRERPYGAVADPARPPRALFVTAIETDPLAPDPALVLAGAEQDFERGVATLTQLTEGLVHVCAAPGLEPPVPTDPRVRVHEISGPHPAGLPGTHMNLIDPVGRGRTSWHVAYPDVVAIGRLFRTGELCQGRVIALAGPRVARPRLLRTRLGADVDDLTAGELLPGACRVVSGSPLSGRQATSWGRHLGRYHRQVCVLEEPRETGRASHAERACARRAGSTARHGARLAQVPTDVFERLVPLDLLPTLLLRALLVGDVEAAEALGCLELEEEDLALCTWACPSKIEYGAHLRAALDRLRGER